MKCEQCGCDLDENTMVSHGEFFVCEDCDDRSVASNRLIEIEADGAVSVDALAAELETKH